MRTRFECCKAMVTAKIIHDFNQELTIAACRLVARAPRAAERRPGWRPRGGGPMIRHLFSAGASSMSDPRFPRLFSPLALRGVTLKNRILSTGHDTNLAAGGLVNERL